MKLPHPVILLFGMMVLAAVASYIMPAGAFDRELIDGRETVIAGTFHSIAPTPVRLGDFFLSFRDGFQTALDVIFIILASGIMFGLLRSTGSLERLVAYIVQLMGENNPKLLIFLSTILFGILGIFVGYENNIAMVPIACMLAIALKGDLILAAGIAVGGMTIGFGMSPFNAYTVGTAHKLGQLPLFSGALYRLFACGLGLSLMGWWNIRYFGIKNLGHGLDDKAFRLGDQQAINKRDILVLTLFLGMLGTMLWGVFSKHWYLKELSALFVAFSVLIAIISKKKSDETGQMVLESIADVAPGAMMVAFAATIKVILEKGQISDTIAFGLSTVLESFPGSISAVGMVISQSIMNFVIPSGSGQALATLPILFPVGDLLGISRQTVTLAFQYGDGISNLINPALGGMVAMLGMCKVPFDRWLKFIWPIFLGLFILSMCLVFISTLFNYGPA